MASPSLPPLLPPLMQSKEQEQGQPSSNCLAYGCRYKPLSPEQEQEQEPRPGPAV